MTLRPLTVTFVVADLVVSLDDSTPVAVMPSDRELPVQPLPAELSAAKSLTARRIPIARLPRGRRPVSLETMDERVAARIATMHEAGASRHTIAAALNGVAARNPTGLRWSAASVARQIADSAP
jgi:hypothetical protein